MTPKDQSEPSTVRGGEQPKKHRTSQPLLARLDSTGHTDRLEARILLAETGLISPDVVSKKMMLDLNIKIQRNAGFSCFFGDSLMENMIQTFFISFFISEQDRIKVVNAQ